MFADLPLFPVQASTMAGRVDALYFFMVAVSAFFSLLIAGLIIYFAIKYRRRSPDETGARTTASVPLEVLWVAVPFGIAMVMFAWGASVYVSLFRPPEGALDVYVVGKQWMWKFQHVGGQAEINELHIPVGRPIRLTMGSEDVIHSFFVPAFRAKMDVIPGRTTTMWFEATRPGRYQLFCAEYCGTLHSGMIGWVVAMEPAAFQEWLAGGATGQSMAEQGEALFQQLACHTCHRMEDEIRGPSLMGVYGSELELRDGRRVVVDQTYVRQAILNPTANVRAGFEPIMPSYQGLVTEEQLLQLIAYIRSLADPTGAQGPQVQPEPGVPPEPGGQPEPPAPGPIPQEARER